MIREFLTHFHWSILPVITMFMFMSVFFGALIWVFRKGSKDIYSELSNLPLDSERTTQNG